MRHLPRGSEAKKRQTAHGGVLPGVRQVLSLALIAVLLGSACHGGPTPAPGSGRSEATQAVAAPGDAELAQAGYQRQMRQGRVVYCRVETVTGSRFSSTVCASKEQVQADWEAAQRQMQGPRLNADCSLTKTCPGG